MVAEIELYSLITKVKNAGCFPERIFPKWRGNVVTTWLGTAQGNVRRVYTHSGFPAVSVSLQTTLRVDTASHGHGFAWTRLRIHSRHACMIANSEHSVSLNSLQAYRRFHLFYFILFLLVLVQNRLFLSQFNGRPPCSGPLLFRCTVSVIEIAAVHLLRSLKCC